MAVLRATCRALRLILATSKLRQRRWSHAETRRRRGPASFGQRGRSFWIKSARRRRARKYHQSDGSSLTQTQALCVSASLREIQKSPPHLRFQNEHKTKGRRVLARRPFWSRPLMPIRERVNRSYSSSSFEASPSSPCTRFCAMRPALPRIAASILSATSLFSVRKRRAASRPCPMRSPS